MIESPPLSVSASKKSRVTNTHITTEAVMILKIYEFCFVGY